MRPARRADRRGRAQIIEEILRFPLPVITAVNGAAIGLGCTVAVLSDIVPISDRAFLCDPGDELLPSARALASRLAGQPAEAPRGAKRVANMYLAQALAGSVRAGFAAERDTMLTDEHRQRVLALRQPLTSGMESAQ